MPIDTLYLIAEQESSPRVLEIAERFLTIADYLHFLLCGVAVIEESLASTTQLYNPATRAWSDQLIETFGHPAWNIAAGGRSGAGVWRGLGVSQLGHLVEAERATSFGALINPNDARFWKPDAMPEKIAAYCRETGQPAPETPGQFTRCIYESLALLYARTLGEIAEVTGRAITRLHIVGGGSQSRLLNQFAASATGCTVHAGPVEATALGNVLLQAVALGHPASLPALREVVRASFAIERYEPQDRSAWQQAAARFAALPG